MTSDLSWKRKQFSEEQIIGILKEAETGAVVTELCRKREMPSATCYAKKVMFGGFKVSDSKRLRSLEEENAGLKRLLHLQATLVMSERRACVVAWAERASIRYPSYREYDGNLRPLAYELAQQRRRFGYRRLHIRLRKNGLYQSQRWNAT